MLAQNSCGEFYRTACIYPFTCSYTQFTAMMIEEDPDKYDGYLIVDDFGSQVICAYQESCYQSTFKFVNNVWCHGNQSCYNSNFDSMVNILCEESSSYASGTLIIVKISPVVEAVLLKKFVVDYNSCGYCHFKDIGYDGVYCSEADACYSPSGVIIMQRLYVDLTRHVEND